MPGIMGLPGPPGQPGVCQCRQEFERRITYLELKVQEYLSTIKDLKVVIDSILYAPDGLGFEQAKSHYFELGGLAAATQAD